jgi:hypothetical protein
MYPKLKINVYVIFLNIGDLTFGITLVVKYRDNFTLPFTFTHAYYVGCPSHHPGLGHSDFIWPRVQVM